MTDGDRVMGDESGPMSEGPASQSPICSARGCRTPAVYAVVWNNPKVHTPDREKVWTACAEHRDTLARFLDLRGFLLRVDEL